MPHNRAVPLIPLLLGAAGLIPFLGLSLALRADLAPDLGWPTEAARLALASYAALIIAFLGGIRWGLGLRLEDPSAAARQYAVAVVPQLLAWAALALPPVWELRALAVLLLALGPLDAALAARGLAPAWFGPLRLGLSTVAGLALLIVDL